MHKVQSTMSFDTSMSESDSAGENFPPNPSFVHSTFPYVYHILFTTYYPFTTQATNPLEQTMTLIKTEQHSFRVIFIPDPRVAFNRKKLNDDEILPPEVKIEYATFPLPKEAVKMMRDAMPEYVIYPVVPDKETQDRLLELEDDGLEAVVIWEWVSLPATLPSEV